MVGGHAGTERSYSFCAGLEPRRQRKESVDRFVDLAATQEDHPQVRLPLLIYAAFLRADTDG